MQILSNHRRQWLTKRERDAKDSWYRAKLRNESDHGIHARQVLLARWPIPSQYCLRPYALRSDTPSPSFRIQTDIWPGATLLLGTEEVGRESCNHSFFKLLLLGDPGIAGSNVFLHSSHGDCSWRQRGRQHKPCEVKLLIYIRTLPVINILTADAFPNQHLSSLHIAIQCHIFMSHRLTDE